jgi:ssRNA-specific RNase YbeY (16S rRNA maturation enzyme)
MGYDDKEETDRKKMREAEKRHMKNLTLKNCLLEAEV